MTSNFTINRTSEQKYFVTGSKRGVNDGKPRYDLISVYGLKRLAEHLAKGAEVYGERNWELGQPVSRFYESALRHLFQWREGENTEDHLAAVLFNVMGIIHMQEEIDKGNIAAELDDINYGVDFMRKYSAFVSSLKNMLLSYFVDENSGMTYLDIKENYIKQFKNEEEFNRALDMARKTGHLYIWYDGRTDVSPEYALTPDEPFEESYYDDY